MGSSQSSSSKYAKRGKISDEDMLKYTGKTKDQLKAWAKDEPGVGGNQAAGKLAMGPTSGVAGMAAGEGLGGWGHKANQIKFPPQRDAKSKAT